MEADFNPAASLALLLRRSFAPALFTSVSFFFNTVSHSEFSGLSFGLPDFNDEGLWHPSHETSSCGIGFVADLTGTPSHRIVVKGLEAVSCLTHRGAVAADSKTGDGAGLLTQIPHKLLHKSLGRGQGKLLKKPEDLAVAMLFCPRDAVARHTRLTRFARKSSANPICSY